MTLIELYNKSHEGFVLSRDQENASISLKLRFKLYRDATLTYVEQSLTLLAWSCTLNKSRSLSGVEQTFFWTKSQISLEISQTEAQRLNQRLFSDLQIF